MDEPAVVIAGGGPTGLMLGAELTLAGVDVVIVERRLGQELDGSRAGGLHARTLEALDQRGVVDRFVVEGQQHPIVGFGGTMLDISDFPTRHNYVLALWQSDFERILARWVEELGVPILRGREVVGCTHDDAGIVVELSDGTSLRASYLVGCDGGRSRVRKAAGIEFSGVDAVTSWLIAEVEMDEEPEFGFRRDRIGTHALNRRQPDEPIRVVLTERHLEDGDDPDLDVLREALIAVYGTDYGLHSASWISRFTDMTRQAVSYRRGRVLLAGDAAHVHPPHGGQGLNLGVQDAVNLGWKLAQVVHGTSPETLLDTYDTERRPVGARVLHNTLVQVALSGPDERHEALRETMTELLGMDEPRRHIVGMISGLDVHYDLGDGHPQLGRRIPDLDVATAAGPERVSALLHEARPVLLTFDRHGAFDITPWAGRVQLVEAEPTGSWELPVLGEVPAPPAVVIRPDGYVAWVGDVTDAGLSDALSFWFGAPTVAADRG